jgi:ketosteroid isomerase-like protein
VIEWRVVGPLVDLLEVSRGHDEVREFWRVWTDGWREIRAEKEEILERGTDVLIVVVWRASGEGGIDFEQRAAFMFTLRDRLMTHVVRYWDPRDAWAWNHPPDPAHSRYPCPPGARSSAG